MKLEISKKDPDIDFITLEGDLDFHATAEVSPPLVKLLEIQSKKILISLEKVGYIDSSGLAVFVELFQKSKRYGGKIVFYSLTPGVRGVFEISKLDTLFKIAASEADAISLLNQS